MNLTPRLQTIAKHVPKNSICGDIGTDHAYIPIYLIENNICNKVIATDVNNGPIDIAKGQIKSTGLEKNIEVRLGDGLKPINPGEVNSIVIAGMGGILIRDILKNSPEITKDIKTFILQPMIAQRELREYLLKNNFIIKKEDLAQENQRIYEIIIAVHGNQSIEEDIYLDIGKDLIDHKHPLLHKLIHRKKDELNKIIKKCEDKKSLNAQKRLKECKDKLKRIEEVETWV